MKSTSERSPKKRVEHRSDSSEWETPDALFNALHKHYEFNWDAAASRKNAKLPNFWTKKDDALKQDWSGKRIWCNPPYGGLWQAFVEKAFNERNRANCIAMLLAARPDTKAFQDIILPSLEWKVYCESCSIGKKGILLYGETDLIFLRGRITFKGAEYPAPFPSALWVLGKDR